MPRIQARLWGSPVSKVLEVDPRRRRFVLSERAANEQKREWLLAELTPGEVRTGVVRNLVDFGAFVDLGGIDGLVHISELDHSHVDHPSDVLSVGDELDVYVLDVDRERERISLSRKRLKPDPWQSVTLGLRQGDVVQGTVTGVQDYGAFVDVGNGVEGLAHVSKMPAGPATLAQLRPGQRVMVRVLNIDNWEKQLGLKVERVGPDESGVGTVGSSGSVRPTPSAGQASRDGDGLPTFEENQHWAAVAG